MKEPRRSRELFLEAQRFLPGGVNSPVRAFKAVGGNPPFIVKAKGSKLYDADGNEYIDYVGSWGALILGHAHPRVVEAIKRAAEHGTSFGAPTELETTLAKMISEAIPSIEMLRFVNSGTEATMSALRLARAFTGRDKIIKFAGGYHGHADGLLVRGGSGLATLGVPDSAGVPLGYAESTLVAPYNNVEAVKQIFEKYPKQVAAIIVEPIAANMGVVLPQPGFLEGLRQLTREFGALLIFDEVITGFRLAYGGRREIMQMVVPLGPVYQAGTLSGNPLAMTAGIETLKVLHRPGVYKQLEAKSARLEEAVTRAATRSGVSISRIASLLTVFFRASPVIDYESAARADTTAFARFFRGLLAEGIYWPPSPFEAAFISLAHSDEDIRRTSEIIDRVLNRGWDKPG